MPYMCAYSIIHVAHTFLPATQLFFCWRDFSLLVRLFFSGATFFGRRDFFSLARLFFLLARLSFAGATFLLARLFFAGATFFSSTHL